jgi:hypothetical protein
MVSQECAAIAHAATDDDEIVADQRRRGFAESGVGQILFLQRVV